MMNNFSDDDLAGLTFFSADEPDEPELEAETEADDPVLKEVNRNAEKMFHEDREIEF
jgi:hypothetical protein